MATNSDENTEAAQSQSSFQGVKRKRDGKLAINKTKEYYIIMMNII